MSASLLYPLLAVVAVLAALLAVREMLALARDRRRYIAGAEFTDHDDRVESSLRSWNNRFVRTRAGAWLARELDLAGLTAQPIVVALVVLLLAAVAATAIWMLLAPVLAAVGLAVAYLGLRAYLRRTQQRRLEKIVTQMPELARVLANASYAGLSLPTALAVASRELPEPVRGELARITNRLNFGAPIETALQEFRDRVRSREVGVLISTLVVSSRSGGSIVTALRGIAESLEQRKETRRQIRTALSGPLVTADVIVGLGVVLLLALNAIQPGTVERMTRSPVGVAGLAIAAALFAGGYVAIRRIARIDA